MPTKKRPLIAMSAPVEITAACPDDDKGPKKFSATFYTGGAMEITGWDLPVVIDLAGLTAGNVLVANLDHDQTKRVGNFDVANDGKSLVAHGTASAATAARDEVVNSAADGYIWQASLEVQPKKVETVKAGKTANANGQTFEGPIYVTREGVLKGFAFVSHGADDETNVSIAASAASHEGKNMEPKLKAWIEAMGFDADNLTDDQLTGLTANYHGQQPPAKAPRKLDEVLGGKKAEFERQQAIIDIVDVAIDTRPYDRKAIELLAGQAMDEKWTAEKLRSELYDASISIARPVYGRGSKDDERPTDNLIGAALCLAGGLSEPDKHFTDQELSTARKRFPNGIGLKQLMCIAAQANNYQPSGFDVDIHVQRAAFGMIGPQQMQRASGFSTFSLPLTMAATANKFLREGFFQIDQTLMQIAAVRSVRNFQTISTISLTGGFMFEQVGPDGQIKHAAAGELAYANKADTYAIMFAITRTDFINDDLGALTVIPRRIGRGGMLKLNDIGWRMFLNNGSFFTSGNANVSTVDGTVSADGLSQAETIFMQQTDPDGTPLGATPKIWLVPTAKHAAARALMSSEFMIGGSTLVPSANVWRDRFTVLSTPYLSNSTYTGYSATASYLLADPNDLPVIEIVALNGRVEPTVETADTDFNTLGVQMRGFNDVGVALQEYRGGVRLDGTAA